MSLAATAAFVGAIAAFIWPIVVGLVASFGARREGARMRSRRRSRQADGTAEPAALVLLNEPPPQKPSPSTIDQARRSGSSMSVSEQTMYSESG